MRIPRLATLLGAALVVMACSDSTTPVETESPDLSFTPVPSTTKAFGKGRYLLLEEFETKFFFHAYIRSDGKAVGSFGQRLRFQGVLIDFKARVTCLTVDAENGRAWIGGVVTRNKSEGVLVDEIHEPGRDVWFRVLDTGEGSAEPDRTTFLGFEGGAGFITSEEYCEAQPWPDDNARTNGITSGLIIVTP